MGSSSLELDRGGHFTGERQLMTVVKHPETKFRQASLALRHRRLRERGRTRRIARRRHDAAGTPAAATAGAVLEPTEQENYVARRVSDIIAREHYRRAPLDDHLSSLILDRYLDAVDSGRSYFYASDIAEFEKYRYELDDAIKAGDVEPAFVIFRRFQQRSRERMNYAIELLQKKPDFDVEESFNFDREKEPWPANAAEMNELWRKRVKNDALSLIITGKQWPEVADILRKRYEHVAKRMDQSKPEDVFEAFMNAFVLSLDPALELLLGAQLRGVQHPDEPLVRGHRRLAPADRRLRHGHRRDRGRPRRGERQALRERSHHRGRRGQDAASSSM